MYEYYSSPEFESRFTYTGNDLGVECSAEKTVFRVWAPTAKAVSVRLYKAGVPSEGEEVNEQSMQQDVCGTWAFTMPYSLDGMFYTYHAILEDCEIEAADPYARAVGVNGLRSMVVCLPDTNPDDWENDHYSGSVCSITDAVIYEVHIRDLSMDASSGIKAKGKFAALSEENSHTKGGSATGLRHMKELGVTHIQLLPIFDFGSMDECNGDRKYNWGYDPVHFNAPEGSYASSPYNGKIRIYELKKAIQTLHKNGLGVVMDVVYNHVYHTREFSINKLVPMYFSRMDENGKLSNATGCGNDTASERSMVRKFIVDSVNFWAEEYHIDGFRFDLAGILDIKTIREVMDTIHAKHPHVLFYGEGWVMPTVPTKENTLLSNQQNAHLLPEFAFFNDTLRDCLRGSVFDASQSGFVTGAAWCKEALSRCFRGNPDWAQSPMQSLNFVSCHDNHTLFDRISIPLRGSSQEDIIKRNMLAAAFVFLSQGVPFLQAGEELLKSKITSVGQYVHNSYRSSDKINSIKWSIKDTPVGNTVFEYYKGLIRIRKSFSFLHYRTNIEAYAHICEYEIPSDRVIGFRIRDYIWDCIIVFNADWSEISVALPDGTWNAIIEGEKAGIVPICQHQGFVNVFPASTIMLLKKF